MVKCPKFNFKYFPFDSQVCNLVVVSNNPHPLYIDQLLGEVEIGLKNKNDNPVIPYIVESLPLHEDEICIENIKNHNGNCSIGIGTKLVMSRLIYKYLRCGPYYFLKQTKIERFL